MQVKGTKKRPALPCVTLAKTYMPQGLSFLLYVMTRLDEAICLQLDIPGPWNVCSKLYLRPHWRHDSG